MIESRQSGRLDEKLAYIFGQMFKHLLRQIGTHVRAAAVEGGQNAIAFLRFRDQQAHHLQRHRPTLGPAVERTDLRLGQMRALAGEKLPRFGIGEAKFGDAELLELAAQPQCRKRKARRAATDEHQPDMFEREIGEDLRHQRLGRVRLGEMVIVEKDDERPFDLAQACRQHRKQGCRRQAAGIGAIFFQPRLQRIDQRKEESFLIGMFGIERHPAELDAVLLQQFVPLNGQRGLAVAGRRDNGRQTAQPGPPKLPQQVATFDCLLPAGRGSKSILSTHGAG